MASSTPPKRAVAFTTYVSLVSQADTKLFQTTVTLAAGDVTVSKDGGAFANITTLPVEISTSGVLALALSATEMTADIVTVRFRDAAGAQWADMLLTLHTVAANFDDLSGRIPAALVGARMDASVGAMAAGALTEAAIAANAITDAKVAADVTIASVTGAVGSVTGAVGSVTAAVSLAVTPPTAVQVRQEIDANSTKLDVAVGTRASQTSIDDVPTNGELATALGTADDAMLAAIAALNNLSAAQLAAADDATLAAIAALNNLSAAAVNAEVDTALADVGLTTTITGRVDAAVSTRLASAGYTAPPSVADILAGVVEGTITLKGALRLMLAVLSGPTTGGGTATVIFRDVANAKARVTATVDASGNRSAIVRDIAD